MKTIRLTAAQAITRWLVNQFIEIGGVEVRVCGGGFGIFGHGNVPCQGEALYPLSEELPLYRGQNEQSMGFAAAASLLPADCGPAYLRAKAVGAAEVSSAASVLEKHAEVDAGRAAQRQGL